MTALTPLGGLPCLLVPAADRDDAHTLNELAVIAAQARALASGAAAKVAGLRAAGMALVADMEEEAARLAEGLEQRAVVPHRHVAGRAAEGIVGECGR